MVQLFQSPHNLTQQILFRVNQASIKKKNVGKFPRFLPSEPVGKIKFFPFAFSLFFFLYPTYVSTYYLLVLEKLSISTTKKKKISIITQPIFQRALKSLTIHCPGRPIFPIIKEYSRYSHPNLNSGELLFIEINSG